MPKVSKKAATPSMRESFQSWLGGPKHRTAPPESPHPQSAISTPSTNSSSNRSFKPSNLESSISPSMSISSMNDPFSDHPDSAQFILPRTKPSSTSILERLDPAHQQGMSKAQKAEPILDSERNRAWKLISELEQWHTRVEAAFKFGEEKVLTLTKVLSELEYMDIMDACGARGRTGIYEYDDDNDDDEGTCFPQHPTLPGFLQPLNVKVRVHDDIQMVIGISRCSSRPTKLHYDDQLPEYYDRAGKFVDFYMRRCHQTQTSNSCCKPQRERVVIFGSSNTDFANTKSNGIGELRDMLTKLEPGQKAVLVCSQIDGLCTNMPGLVGFLQPFLEKRVQLDLMIWWSNSEFYLYDVERLVSQYLSRSFCTNSGLDPHYQTLLGSMARIAVNKEGIARASRANKREGLGFRNVRIIGPDEDLPTTPGNNVLSMTSTAKQERLRDSLKTSKRAVAEIPLIKDEEGLFVCPTDAKTFVTVRDMVEHLVQIVLQSQGDRICIICGTIFQGPRVGHSGKARTHLSRHLFEKIDCPEDDCKYWAKTDNDLDSHLQHIHFPEEKIDKSRSFKCGNCGDTFTMQYHLSRHQRNLHIFEPVTCEDCGSVLKHEDSLQDHRSRVCPALPRKDVGEEARRAYPHCPCSVRAD